MSHDELQRWMDGWDGRISSWLEAMDGGADPAGCDLGLGPVRDAWLASNPQLGPAEIHRALPEPWAGDPLADDLQGVAIYHNPGGALAVQLHPAGSLLTRLRGGDPFSTLARSWELAQKTTEWWLRPAEWFARITGGPLSRRQPAILGLDLVPWHSTERGPLPIDEATADHLRRDVFEPARAAAARGRLRTTAGAPLVLASHEWVCDVIRALGAEPLAVVDETSWNDADAPWPRSFRGQATQRTFERLRLPLAGGDLELLATWAPGSNFPPGRAFDPIVRALGVELAP